MKRDGLKYENGKTYSIRGDGKRFTKAKMTGQRRAARR